MATFVGLHNKVFVGHLDLTGKTSEVSFGPLTRAMQPSTTFADGGYSCVKPGLISGEATVKAFQDFDVDVFDDEISIGQLGTQYPVTVIPNPTGTVTAGDVCWMSRGLLGSHNSPWTKGEMATTDLMLPYDTAVTRSLVAAQTTATVTGSGSALALTGPSASQRLYAALHVTAYSGLTSAVFSIQSDNAANMSSPTTRIAFATATGRTSEWSSVAGDLSTETHWRVAYTANGVGSVSFLVAFGVI